MAAFFVLVFLQSLQLAPKCTIFLGKAHRRQWERRWNTKEYTYTYAREVIYKNGILIGCHYAPRRFLVSEMSAPGIELSLFGKSKREIVYDIVDIFYNLFAQSINNCYFTI
jgi:hypothetical protein